MAQTYRFRRAQWPACFSNIDGPSTVLGFLRREKGNRSTITVGFGSDGDQMSAAMLLSRRKHHGINRGQPITLSLVWDVPTGHCHICYHPDNPQGYSRGHSKPTGQRYAVCPNTEDVCFLCHRQGHSIAECGYEYKFRECKRNRISRSLKALSRQEPSNALVALKPNKGRPPTSRCFPSLLRFSPQIPQQR